MIRPRVIPCLLLRGQGLVKTTQFKKPVYLGDPINTLKLFNDKEVDEIAILDIDATRERRGPNFAYLEQLVSESFMPLAYGGGVTTVADMQRLYQLGIEKVILNTAASRDLIVVHEAAHQFGGQSVVVSIDVKKSWSGKYQVVTEAGSKKVRRDVVAYAKAIEAAGAGEILLTAIHCDGMRQGYDLALIEQVASAVGIPVVACGGAGSLSDFTAALQAGAHAVAAGSIFVFHGRLRSVLITYPEPADVNALPAVCT